MVRVEKIDLLHYCITMNMFRDESRAEFSFSAIALLRVASISAGASQV